jgi:hypothetical protein
VQSRWPTHHLLRHFSAIGMLPLIFGDALCGGSCSVVLPFDRLRFARPQDSRATAANVPSS